MPSDLYAEFLLEKFSDTVRVEFWVRPDWFSAAKMIRAWPATKFELRDGMLVNAEELDVPADLLLDPVESARAVVRDEGGDILFYTDVRVPSHRVRNANIRLNLSLDAG